METNLPLGVEIHRPHAAVFRFLVDDLMGPAQRSRAWPLLSWTLGPTLPRTNMEVDGTTCLSWNMVFQGVILHFHVSSECNSSPEPVCI